MWQWEVRGWQWEVRGDCITLGLGTRQRHGRKDVGVVKM